VVCTWLVSQQVAESILIQGIEDTHGPGGDDFAGVVFAAFGLLLPDCRGAALALALALALTLVDADEMRPVRLADGDALVGAAAVEGAAGMSEKEGLS
jgi:hypothetical protein